MSADENKAFIRRYLSALSGQDKPLSVIRQYVAEEEAALIEHILDAEHAFPHYELVVEDLIAEGDKVNVRARFRGVHRGEFMGIPATGREFDVAAFVTYRISNNRIVEHWLLPDSLALMQQLGVVATPEAGRE